MSQYSPNAFLQLMYIWSSTLRRMYFVAYYILFMIRNESIMVNNKKIQILYNYFTLQCMIKQSFYFFWPRGTTYTIEKFCELVVNSTLKYFRNCKEYTNRAVVLFV